MAFHAIRAHSRDIPGKVSGEADSLPLSLTGKPGSAVQGRLLVADRNSGNCLLCHKLPLPQERFQGDLGPSLDGVGSRLSAGEIRLRLVDGARINPATIMPAYFKVEGLARVGAAYSGKTILAAGQVEDIVAYLETLKD